VRIKDKESVKSKKSFEFEFNNEERNKEDNRFSTGNFGNVIA
jgi:hypothetical protein